MTINSHVWQVKILIPVSEAEAMKSFVEGGLDLNELQERQSLVEAMYCGRCGVPFDADTETAECGVTPEEPTP
jgi:hypothetical protein